MAKMTVGKGLDDYISALAHFRNSIKDDVIGAAIYAGAGVVADAVRNSIEALPVVDGWGTPSHPLPGGVTAEQKAGLLQGLDIAHERNDGGFRNVRLGFGGYNATKTKKFPQGQPNMLVARACESGTSWKRKKPFVRPAVNRARSGAEDKMRQVVDDACRKAMN